jgi:hypothetical protein
MERKDSNECTDFSILAVSAYLAFFVSFSSPHPPPPPQLLQTQRISPILFLTPKLFISTISTTFLFRLILFRNPCHSISGPSYQAPQRIQNVFQAFAYRIAYEGEETFRHVSRGMEEGEENWKGIMKTRWRKAYLSDLRPPTLHH